MEPELRGAPPREDVWHEESAQRERLREWAAVKAWVARVDSNADGDEFRVWFGVELAGRLQQRTRVWRFDKHHWWMGSRDHAEWWQRQIVPGGTVTLLIEPGRRLLRRARWVLYGDLHPYLTNPKRWAADRA